MHATNSNTAEVTTPPTASISTDMEKSKDKEQKPAAARDESGLEKEKGGIESVKRYEALPLP